LECLLAYAILAPSTHNTQPWLFRINATDVELWADRRRQLHVIDPQGRELLISCGAALFNLRIAAEYFEKATRTELFPDPQRPDLVARLHLGLHGESGSEDLVLFHAIQQRHTHRGPFRNTVPADEILEELSQIAVREGAWCLFGDSPEAHTALADLVAEADQRQWADRHFRAELAAWVREHPEKAVDGIPVQSLGIRDWLSFAGPSLIRTFDRGQGQAARDRDIALHSPVLAVLGTEQDDPLAWVAAGQALQAFLLQARSEDLWASFLCQPVEIPELRSRLSEICSQPNPQVLLRLGYADPATPAPRREVRSALIRQPDSRHT
jgi:nitroreductase